MRALFRDVQYRRRKECVLVNRQPWRLHPPVRSSAGCLDTALQFLQGQNPPVWRRRPPQCGPSLVDLRVFRWCIPTEMDRNQNRNTAVP